MRPKDVGHFAVKKSRSETPVKAIETEPESYKVEMIFNHLEVVKSQKKSWIEHVGEVTYPNEILD